MTAKPTADVPGALTVAGLRCEYRTDPLGIDEKRPRLSWRVESRRRAQKQTAYRILVAACVVFPIAEGTRWQDVEPILETNTALRNTQTPGWKGEMHYVAKLPMYLWQSLRTEGRVQEVKDFKKWLNDPDHSKWRTKTGRL